jgi:hypothetical protein
MPPVADPGSDFFFSHAWGIRGSGNARRSFPNGALAGIDCSSHGGDDDGGSRWRFLMMGVTAVLFGSNRALRQIRSTGAAVSVKSGCLRSLRGGHD